jgi:hypothetical protein
MEGVGQLVMTLVGGVARLRSFADSRRKSIG